MSAARVDELEKKSGWAINKIEASVMFMTYKREIELAFDLASFFALYFAFMTFCFSRLALMAASFAFCEREATKS